MQEVLIILGGCLGVLATCITLAKYLFYTKSEINTKIAEMQKTSDKKDELLLEKVNNMHNEIKDELTATKEYIHKNLLDAERNSSHITQEFTNLLNAVKDELRADSITRYNDLLQMLNTKVTVSDFDRLENKFDKVSETITELKTIIQMEETHSRKNK